MDYILHGVCYRSIHSFITSGQALLISEVWTVYVPAGRRAGRVELNTRILAPEKEREIYCLVRSLLNLCRRRIDHTKAMLVSFPQSHERPHRTRTGHLLHGCDQRHRFFIIIIFKQRLSSTILEELHHLPLNL